MCTLDAISLLEGNVYEAIVEVKNALGFNTSSPVVFKANKYEIFLSEYTYNLLLNIISNIIYMHVPRYFVALLGRNLPALGIAMNWTPWTVTPLQGGPPLPLMLLCIQNISSFLIGANHGQLVLTLSDIQGNIMTPMVVQAIASK